MVNWKSLIIWVLAITYFISPIDLFPETILGPVGYIDDIIYLYLAYKYAGSPTKILK